MSGKLLIVDDDQPTCELLAAKLATEGHGVTWETAPAEAIEHLQHDDFDALLTDLAMPGTNGLDLCARALQIEPELPVIVVTGHADLEAAVSAMRVGAYDFITKPVDTKLLAHAIE